MLDTFLAKASQFVAALPVQIALGLLALALVAAVETARLGWSRSSLAAMSQPSARRDLIVYALDLTGIYRVVGHALTLGLGYAAGVAARRALGFDLVALPSNVFVQVALFLLAKSFVDYWMHRAMHRFAPLWEIHKYHHSASEMNIVTAHRESVLVAPFVAIWFAVPLGILGAPVETFLIAGFLIEAHALLIHSRLPFGFGRVGERLLISPAAHRLHHALEVERHGHNYGFLVSIWDHLFGTYARAEAAHAIAIGVDDPVYNTKPWHHEQAYSIRRFVASVRGRTETAR